MIRECFDVDLGYIAVYAEVIVLEKNRTKRELNRIGHVLMLIWAKLLCIHRSVL